MAFSRHSITRVTHQFPHLPSPSTRNTLLVFFQNTRRTRTEFHSNTSSGRKDNLYKSSRGKMMLALFIFNLQQRFPFLATSPGNAFCRFRVLSFFFVQSFCPFSINLRLHFAFAFVLCTAILSFFIHFVHLCFLNITSTKTALLLAFPQFPSFRIHRNLYSFLLPCTIFDQLSQKPFLSFSCNTSMKTLI